MFAGIPKNARIVGASGKEAVIYPYLFRTTFI